MVAEPKAPQLLRLGSLERAEYADGEPDIGRDGVEMEPTEVSGRRQTDEGKSKSVLEVEFIAPVGSSAGVLEEEGGRLGPCGGRAAGRPGGSAKGGLTRGDRGSRPSRNPHFMPTYLKLEGAKVRSVGRMEVKLTP